MNDERKRLDALSAAADEQKCDECGHPMGEHAASGCTHEGCECTRGVRLEQGDAS